MRLFLLGVGIFITSEPYLFAAEAGMPQLDPKYWASQAFWLILVFTALYLTLSNLFIPKIKDNIDNRENKIKDDLDEAQKLKNLTEQKLKEYEQSIENAKKEVQKIIFGNYLSGAMRNPSAAQKQFPNLLLGFALAEATGLFGLVIALIILFAF